MSLVPRLMVDQPGAMPAVRPERHTQPSMEFPGIARFSLAADGRCVTAVPHPDSDLDEVIDLYRRSAVPVFLQAAGMEVLHASAVLTPRGVIGLCAEARTGKSTLAYALARRGYRAWADDALAVELSTDPVTTSPLPFRLRLRPSAAAYFARELAPESPGARVAAGQSPQPLAALVVLRRSERGALTLRHLAPARAFAALLPHAYCFSLRELGDKRRIVERYLELARRVPVQELEFPPCFEALPDTLDALERLVTHPS